MARRMRVYVSSTTRDLQEHRKAVADAIRQLGSEAVAMEDYVSQDAVPVEKCLRDVGACDAYVGIFAWRYGHIPPGHPKSITDLECCEARRRGIPVLAFLLHEDAPWPPSHMDEELVRIKALRQELCQQRLVRFFHTLDELRSELTAALAQLLVGDGAQRAGRGHGEAEPVVGVLPSITHFTGRRKESGWLKAAFTDANVRCVWIVGPGGIGKSTLMARFCSDIANGELRFLDRPGTMGIDGMVVENRTEAELPMVERLFSDVARMLGGDRGERLLDWWQDPSFSLADKTTRLLHELRDGWYLLVLDNFEDELARDGTIGTAEMREFLEICLGTTHGLRVLITSRHYPRLDHRVVDAVHFVPLDALGEAEAVALLRALDADGQQGIGDAPETVLADAARRCACVPFALKKIHGILVGHRRMSLERLLSDETLFGERVVEKLIEYQYRDIREDERRVLEALSIYTRPVPAEAISHVLRPHLPDLDVEGCLDSLVQQNLVPYQRQPDSFGLHALDRQYAYSRIPEEGSDYTRSALHAGAASYFLQCARHDPGRDIEWMSAAWEHRFRGGEDDSHRELAREAEALAAGPSEPGGRARAAKGVLCGYRALLEHTGKSDHGIVRAIAEVISGAFQSEAEQDALMLSVGETITRLYWLTRTSGDHFLFRDLRALCSACSEVSVRHGRQHDAWLWFAYTVRAALLLRERGHPLQPREISGLVSWVEGVSERDPDRILGRETKALYLEMLGQFLPAAEASEDAARQAEQHGNRYLAASLFVRGAECYRAAGESGHAAEALIKAASLMAHHSRASVRALAHYEEAARLHPCASVRARLEPAIAELRSRLQQLERKCLAIAAVVSNPYDLDFGDALVAPLAERGIGCRFEDSKSIRDLAELSSSGGIIVLGSIWARDTDRHLRHYFYDIPSLNEGLTFRSEDTHRAGTRRQGPTHFCDFWFREIADTPVYVLAGARRELTCQAVLRFIDSEHFEAFARRVRGA